MKASEQQIGGDHYKGMGGDADIAKAAHHLAKLVEVIAEANEKKMPVAVDPNPFRAQRYDPSQVYDRDQDRWTTCK